MFGAVRGALDLTAAALASGEVVPAQAIELMAEPIMPAAVYRSTGNQSFRSLAEKRGAGDRLYDRPYDQR